MRKKFTSKIDRLHKLRLNHITVPLHILEHFHEESDKSVYNQRFRITLNNSVSWLGGSVVLGNNEAYITVSSLRMKELGAHLGDDVEVELEKDRSEYGLDVPEEWTVALDQDPEAKRRFEQLSMGTRRSIIYMVIQYKSVEKRIEKSLFFLENLKRSPEGNTTMRHILGKDL